MKQYAFDIETESSLVGELSSTTSLYVGQMYPQWAMNGLRYMASIMLKIAMQYYKERYPISINTFFVKPGNPGPYIVEMEAIKTSPKSLCTMMLRLKQRKKNSTAVVPTNNVSEYNPNEYDVKCFSVVTMSGTVPEQGLTVIHPDVPKAPSFDDMVPVPPQFDGDQTLNTYQDLKATSKGAAETHQAFEFPDGRPIDTVSLAFLLDMYRHPLHVLKNKNGLGITDSWKPTLQYEIQFKRPLKAPIPRALLTYMVPYAIDGRFDIDGWLYDDKGEIVATTRHQLLIIQRKKKFEGTKSNL
ncbi:thioesterase-like superfamily-domain-containing protein [Fennellomyces sp. T-0311]|nr:thioesterase-like superfamily-domain-containing protein [Fennellomyces sp. T-0311]